jgi:hypothetical protein
MGTGGTIVEPWIKLEPETRVKFLSQDSMLSTNNGVFSMAGAAGLEPAALCLEGIQYRLL